MMTKRTFTNPILSGFYPDPSICRVGEDYYLVTSSFVYYPGLPIFHSRDLVHWKQIGHGIHRPDQLDYKNCETSLGLWAPTIRYHEGKFYIINTFVSEGREARRDNYIISADDPAGPWSEPIFVEGADGIDSSLFFDDDGRVWYTGNYIVSEPQYVGHHGIYICEIDIKTGQFIGERKIAWDGANIHGHYIEAPHLYKHEGYYYLMVAEGGTFVEHSVQIARSKSVTGPYEPCPRNPIVSHRHRPLNIPISVVGHGDLVETQNGEWWMVLLGIRTYEETHFNTGRETYLVPMRWASDGWPMVDNDNGMVNEVERCPDLKETKPIWSSANDSFESTELSFKWNTIHPTDGSFYSLTDRPGFLRLFLKPEVMGKICTPAFLGRRQEHRNFLAKTVMEFDPKNESEESGISIIQDDRFHYSFVVGKKSDKKVLRLYETKNGKKELKKEQDINDQSKIYLTVFCTTETYEFYYGYDETNEILFLDNCSASLLSSDVNEGFTGVYLGPYATSNGETSQNHADYDWFWYQGGRK